MAKVVRHLREGQQEFQKIFSKLCERKYAWQAWSDFVEMTAIAISNSCEIRPKVKQDREARYRAIVSDYTEKEQALFPKMLTILVSALQRSSEQDFLGEMFMALELGNHWKGQFFTPYDVCKAMAQITVTKEEANAKIAVKGFVAVNDPACGAGATLIAARNSLALAGIGGSKAWFVAQDIDRTAAMMCYVQLSLLGCAGYVVVADTLNNPITGPLLWPHINESQDVWFLPLNFIDPTWVIRISRVWRGVDEPYFGTAANACEPDAEQPEAAPNPAPILSICDDNGQFSLF